MSRAAFHIGLGQQVGAKLVEDVGNRLRIEQLRINRVVGCARQAVLDAASELLGTQPAMDQEFLELVADFVWTLGLVRRDQRTASVTS